MNSNTIDMLSAHVGPRLPGGQKLTRIVSTPLTDADYRKLKALSRLGGTASIGGYVRLLIQRHLRHGVPIDVVTEQASYRQPGEAVNRGTQL